eukprot:2190008-Amphidinium_carterae.1
MNQGVLGSSKSGDGPRPLTQEAAWCLSFIDMRVFRGWCCVVSCFKCARHQRISVGLVEAP